VTPEEAGRLLNVSRETLDRLQAYVDLLQKWQRRINLVSAGTLPAVWQRHILDSGQLAQYLPANATDGIVDLGSGAGLPGLILAIVAERPVDLIESDSRKCAFLLEAARVTGASVKIHRRRAEGLAPWPANVLTARALAPLPRLLELGEGFIDPDRTVCLFLKGREAEQELTDSAKHWNMRAERFASLSDPSGSILRLSGVQRSRDRNTA
jgi:16S rRNA (guanine527-N7)-methyltransferase